MGIFAENLSYTYMPGTVFEVRALSGISLSIGDKEFVAIMGHTGSGKSTLIQMMNGLLKPTDGRITVQGMCTSEKGVSLREMRKKVGLVFQYPEYQLFEETVGADVAFGPKNLGLGTETAQEQARQAMQEVGLCYDEFKDRSPFELSGGQKRRVAMAGVLAMNPEVLILDEPTAGLDPRSRDETLGLLSAIHKERGCTVIMVSHNMDEIAKVAQRVLVLAEGRLMMDDAPSQVFSHAQELRAMNLGVPATVVLAEALRRRGADVPDGLITVNAMHAWLRERGLARHAE